MSWTEVADASNSFTVSASASGSFSTQASASNAWAAAPARIGNYYEIDYSIDFYVVGDTFSFNDVEAASNTWSAA